MTNKPVRLTLEAFGNRTLSAIVTREEVEDKTFADVVRLLADKNYSGEDAQTALAIRKQMIAGKEMTTQVGIGTPNRFEPVALGEKVTRYIQKPQGLGAQETLRTTVLGIQDLGYNL